MATKSSKIDQFSKYLTFLEFSDSCLSNYAKKNSVLAIFGFWIFEFFFGKLGLFFNLPKITWPYEFWPILNGTALPNLTLKFFENWQMFGNLVANSKLSKFFQCSFIAYPTWNGSKIDNFCQKFIKLVSFGPKHLYLYIEYLMYRYKCFRPNETNFMNFCSQNMFSANESDRSFLFIDQRNLYPHNTMMPGKSDPDFSGIFRILTHLSSDYFQAC